MFKYYNNFIFYIFLIFFILFFFKSLTIREDFNNNKKKNKKKNEYINLTMMYVKNENHFEYKIKKKNIQITPSTNQIAYSFKGGNFDLKNIDNNSYLFNDSKLIFNINYIYRDTVLFTIDGGGYTLYFVNEENDDNKLIIYDYYQENNKDRNIVGNITSKNIKNIKLNYPSFYKLKILKNFEEIVNVIFISTLIYYNKIYHYDNYPYTTKSNESSDVKTVMQNMDKENKINKKEEKKKKEKRNKICEEMCEEN